MTSTTVLRVENLSGFASVEQFYTQFGYLLNQGRYKNLTIDLSQVDFIVPEAVIALICVARSWYDYTDEPVSLLVQPQVHKYLERINLFQVCEKFIQSSHDLHPNERWSRSGSLNLMEVTPISSDEEQNAQDLYQIHTRAMNLLLGRVNADRVKPVCNLLYEIVENITHSEDRGYVLMQVYTRYEGSRVHIGIADLGIGVEASLREKYPHFGSGSQYLLRAMDAGISSRTESGGLGLHNVRRIVKDGRGTLTIRSASSIVQVFEDQIFLWDDCSFIPGTQVFISVWGHHENQLWQYLLPKE